MQFNFYHYSDSQIKQRHNSKMIYQSYLEILERYNLNFHYKMFWQKHKDGYEQLVKQHQKTNKREYIGRRAKESEEILKKFIDAKAKMKESLSNIKQKLQKDEKLNKLEGIARAPKELVAIFRKINELNLDDKLIVIGTNSLYLYEAHSGVMVEQEHLATHDIDLLNRKDKGFSFLFKELMMSKYAIDLIKSIDSSFYQSKEVPYRFINKNGIWIELINPISHAIKQDNFKDNFFTDVVPLAMTGIQWLENSRLFKETIIGEDGKCAQITTIHPLEYAIYKNWLGRQADRDFQKHHRDLQQSSLVTKMITDYMPNVDIDKELLKIKHFKKEAIESYKKEILEKSPN